MKPRKRVGNYWHVLIRCNTLRSETKKGWVEKKKRGGGFPDVTRRRCTYEENCLYCLSFLNEYQTVSYRAING